MMNLDRSTIADTFQQLVHAIVGQSMDKVEELMALPYIEQVLKYDKNVILLQSAVRVDNPQLTALLSPHFDPFDFGANAFRLAIFNNAAQAFEQLLPKFFNGSSDQRSDVFRYAVKECRPNFVEQLLPSMSKDELDWMIVDAKDLHTINVLIPHSSPSALSEACFHRVRNNSSPDCITALFEHANTDDVLGWCHNSNVSGDGMDHFQSLIDAKKLKEVLVRETGQIWSINIVKKNKM